MHTMGERKQRQHEECAAAHHLCQRQRWAAVRPGQGEGEGRGAGATRGASVRTYGLRATLASVGQAAVSQKHAWRGASPLPPCPACLASARKGGALAAAVARRGACACRGREEGAAARLLSRKVGREAARTYHAAPQVATPTPLPSPAHSHFHPPAMSAARAREGAGASGATATSAPPLRRGAAAAGVAAVAAQGASAASVATKAHATAAASRMGARGCVAGRARGQQQSAPLPSRAVCNLLASEI